ncbi:MAG: flagellar hook protein, partial [Erythrobacter sp. 34-65-8]
METNPASSIVKALGVGSGVDMIQLAGDLAKARFQAQISQLESRSQILETKISAASTLRSQVSQLSSALGERIRTGDLAPMPSIADSAVATARGTPGVRASGTYSLEVTQLASAQVLASSAFATAQDQVGEGTLAIRFGAVDGAVFTEDTARTAVSIAVNASDTLETLAAKISGSGEGLVAYVATNASGAQLVIKGQEGVQQAFVVEGISSAAIPAATAGDLSYLTWSPATDAGQLRQAAGGAAFRLDGVEMTAATNQVRGLPAGLSLELTGTNIGNPTTIGFSEPVDAISA